jgi:hypothetical protein
LKIYKINNKIIFNPTNKNKIELSSKVLENLAQIKLPKSHISHYGFNAFKNKEESHCLPFFFTGKIPSSSCTAIKYVAEGDYKYPYNYTIVNVLTERNLILSSNNTKCFKTVNICNKDKLIM